MMKPTIIAAALLVALTAAGPAPEPPPSPDQIKACVQQFDMGKHWRFDWKVLDIGPARHPQNNLEALGQLASAQDHYGYPIHVAYTLNGGAQIDSIYWLIRDARGVWQIPAICQLR
jgi:hypothetical protein